MITKGIRQSRFCLVILAAILPLLLTQTKVFQFIFVRNYGAVAWLKGDLSTARSTLETLVKDRPSDSILHWCLYNIYEEEGLTTKAISHLRLSGYDWQTLSKMGDTFLWPAQDWSNALLWYTRARNVHENSTILFKLGRIYEFSEEPLLAFEVYTRALQINTFETNEVDISNTLVRLASIYRNKHNDPNTALLLADQALELDRFGTHLDEKAEAYYLQGEIGALQGRTPSFCIEKFQRALEISPKHYWVNLRLGVEYYRAGLALETAVAQMQYAISLQPESKWGYLLLANLYAEVGNVVEAKQYYEHVLILAPDDLTALKFLQNNP